MSDDPEINKRKTKRLEVVAKDNEVAATIAQRLTENAKVQTVNVPMQDAAGDYEIPMRVPSWGDTVEINRMESLMEEEKGREKLATLMAGLSDDPSLDYDFWYSGSIGLIDMRRLIEGLTTEALKKMQEVQSFRKK